MTKSALLTHTDGEAETVYAGSYDSCHERGEKWLCETLEYLHLSLIHISEPTRPY